MKTLRQDLEMAMTLMGNIKLREMIKLEVMEIEVLGIFQKVFMLIFKRFRCFS